MSNNKVQKKHAFGLSKRILYAGNRSRFPLHPLIPLNPNLLMGFNMTMFCVAKIDIHSYPIIIGSYAGFVSGITILIPIQLGL